MSAGRTVLDRPTRDVLGERGALHRVMRAIELESDAENYTAAFHKLQAGVEFAYNSGRERLRDALEASGLGGSLDAIATDIAVLERRDRVVAAEWERAASALPPDRLNDRGQVLLDAQADVGEMLSPAGLENRLARAKRFGGHDGTDSSRDAFRDHDQLHLKAGIDVVRGLERAGELRQAQGAANAVGRRLDQAIKTGSDAEGRSRLLDAEIGKLRLMERASTFQVLLDSPSSVAGRVQVAQLGQFTDSRYGDFAITAADVAAWSSNLSRLPGGRALIDLDHNADRSPRNTEAAGWITGVKMDNGVPMADVEWTPVGKQAIEDKRYLFFSPAYGDFKDEHGTVHANTLTGGALTNKPFLSAMPTITLASADRVRTLEDAPPPAAPRSDVNPKAIELDRRVKDRLLEQGLDFGQYVRVLDEILAEDGPADAWPAGLRLATEPAAPSPPPGPRTANRGMHKRVLRRLEQDGLKMRDYPTMLEQIIAEDSRAA